MLPRLLAPHGVEQRVPVDRLAVGDLFVVRPGEKITTDGVIVEGSSAVDTALLTPHAGPEEGIVFVGGTNWFPNLDALRYFCEEILPAVSRTFASSASASHCASAR